MKIMDNGTIREMTLEEIDRYINVDKTPDATEVDYQNALEKLGVKYEDN